MRVFKTGRSLLNDESKRQAGCRRRQSKRRDAGYGHFVPARPNLQVSVEIANSQITSKYL